MEDLLEPIDLLLLQIELLLLGILQVGVAVALEIQTTLQLDDLIVRSGDFVLSREPLPIQGILDRCGADGNSDTGSRR